MPQGDLAGWKQVIAEDFTTDIGVGGFVVGDDGLLTDSCAAHAAYGSRLSGYQDGPTDNGGLYRVARTVSVTDSILDIHTRTDPVTGKLLSAAIYPFRAGQPSNAHTYGRWSYRLRSLDATGTGIICVSLLFPERKQDWPRSGEMDWPECDVSGAVGGNHHPAGYRTNMAEQISGLGLRLHDWHTFTLDWRKGSLSYLVDGITAFSTKTHVPSGSLKWDIQCSPDPARRTLPRNLSAHVQLDWVVAYDPA
ncbi:glycoside hydrolase family 16 protein [Allobranchiibius huperziae]|uniref:GH16 domain-containing protein n=1 Tax=Allobranchiibius huperziae TaxID=1874116 RepID=A0A853DFT0_9MICO|nr:glycoside hydrolase family 16 protein [Allobranchiibius huperziae]NYJ75658.1 hypothetical protein [Allobranchiibius huperziae]